MIATADASPQTASIGLLQFDATLISRSGATVDCVTSRDGGWGTILSGAIGCIDARDGAGTLLDPL